MSRSHSEYGGEVYPFLVSQVFWVANLIYELHYFSVLRFRYLVLPKHYIIGVLGRSATS